MEIWLYIFYILEKRKRENKKQSKTKKQNKKLIDEMVENLNDAPHKKYLQKYFSIKITQSKTKMLHLIFKKKF